MNSSIGLLKQPPNRPQKKTPGSGLNTLDKRALRNITDNKTNINLKFKRVVY